MCGFVGFLPTNGKQTTEEQFEQLKAMNQLIYHRGPDDEGYVKQDDILMGFRRLSIIDLAHGKQPLTEETGRYTITFNGEIYNYIELREQLRQQGYTFKTDSDTEVLVVAYRHFGREVVDHLRGMFAFLIWDAKEKTLFAARDHFGIKPLYYTLTEQGIYFASEKKSLDYLYADKKLDPISLQHYMTFQYVPGPKTLDPRIQLMTPGHSLWIESDKKMLINRYFHATFAPIQQAEEAFVQPLQEALIESVEKHMRSDVVVGSFLSGGIDSSIVVSIARQFNPKLKTLSVGFEREGYSEIDVAKETADVLGVENISKVITPEEFMAVFPTFVWHMDDPLADPAAVPQYFVSELASQHVKVALSGEGADEMFGGYTIYNEPNSLKIFTKLPRPLLTALRQIARIIPEGVKGKSFIERGTMRLEDRFVGNAKIFDEPEKRRLLTQYDARYPYQTITRPFYQECAGQDPIDRMQYIDIHTWLRDDLLLNADRTTMAHSLELRTPFVDKEIFNIARTIPSNLRIANQTTKYILRKAAEGIVPDHVLYRKKLGFPVPIRHWLKQELYQWAKTIIEESSTQAYINRDYVLGLLEDHRAGKRDHSRKIWTVLTFMVWYRIYIEEDLSQVKKPQS